MSRQPIWAIQTRSRTVDLERFSAEVRPVSGAMGAYVHGLDVRDIDIEQLSDLLHAFKAVMLRDQPSDLSIADYVAFGRTLGELAIDPYVESSFADYPEVMRIVRDAESDGYNFGGDWHSDGSYLERPGGLTVLWGKHVPSHGGDTLFADMELAWEALTPSFREMLDGRRALHAATGLGHKVEIRSKGDYVGLDRSRPLDRIEHLHPIKRTHPETGRPALFVNQAYSVGIEGCSDDESAAILRFLFDHSCLPALTARMVWEPGTILIWDNRVTTHYAIGDYGGQHREMYRLAVTGEVPV